MHRYIIQRLLTSIPIVLGITFVTFLIINAAPGDPVDLMVNPMAGVSPEAVEARREALGLNEPLLVRYALWLKEVASGNLGYSLVNREPVLDRIGRRLLADDPAHGHGPAIGSRHWHSPGGTLGHPPLFLPGPFLHGHGLPGGL